MKKRATIHDVARLANVSIKTVSRVFHNEPNVRPETRKLVSEAIHQLGYRPTVSARSTVSGRSFLIGLVFDNPNPAYTFDLLLGAQKAARDNGYHLVVEPIDRDPGQQITDLIIQSNLEGVIIPPPLCDNPSVIEAVESLNRPMSRIAPSTAPDTGFTVEMDDVAAAKAMTEHLIGLGHKRIGFIMGREGTATTRRRHEGFCTAMYAAGLEIDPDLIVQGDFQLRSGLEAGETLLKSADRPTAIFASNDDMAAGVLMAAHKLGIDVPDDLSIAGFDDSITARAMWPQLTTIRQPVADMAAYAAARIIDHQRNVESAILKHHRLDFQLIARASTGPAPTAQ